MAERTAHVTDRGRLFWVMPLVTVVVVAIELMMTGRFDRTGLSDLALSLAISVVAIQVAARIARHTVVVGLLYVLCFTFAWYMLTFVALGGVEDLRAGNTMLVEGGALTVEGHVHFLSRPFRFAVFTLLLSLMALWGLWGPGPRTPE